MRHLFLPLVLATTIGLASAAFAQSVAATNARADQLFGEHRSLQDAFQTVKAAVQNGDAETLADMAQYPLTVHVNGETYDILTRDDFITNFRTIMASSVYDAVTSQDYETLFLNSDGAMFGNGQIWLTAVCTDNSCSSSYWTISAIND